MTTEQLEQASIIKHKLEAAKTNREYYLHQLGKIDRRLSSDLDTSFEMRVPCNECTIEFIKNLIEIEEIVIEGFQDQFASI